MKGIHKNKGSANYGPPCVWRWRHATAWHGIP